MSDSNRRQFARDMLIGTSALLAGQTFTSAAEADEELTPGAHLIRVLVGMYPANLTPAHVAKLRERLDRQMARSQALSSFPLTNGDEPAVAFRAFRGPDA